MKFARYILLIGVAAILLSLSGCVFKKKQPPVPQQGQAPTVSTPQPPPEEKPAPPEEKPVEQPPETRPTEETKTTEEKPKPKKKPAQAKKPAAPAPAAQPPAQASGSAPAAPAKTSKLIIQEGSAQSNQGQLAAGLTLEDPSSHNKLTTEQLLHGTQANLNNLNRPLSPEEQAMVAQIKDYMAQSRKAADDSDMVRAHNLALKAHLLSDELVKH